jgi:tetratricopeptide (TPR) repeat protein
MGVFRSFLQALSLLLVLTAIGCTKHYQEQYDFYYRLNDWEGAERVLRKDLLTDPRNPEILFLLGQVYGHWEKYDKMDEVFDLSSSVTKRYGFDIEQYRSLFAARQLNRGIDLYNRNRYEEAVDELEWVETIRKDETRHNKYLGLSYSALGEYGKAERSLELAVELEGDRDSKWELIHVYEELGNDSGIIDLAEQLLVETPGQIDLLNIAARAYGNVGNDAAAISKYEEILAIIPSDRAIQYNLAVHLTRVGRKTEAIPLLEQISSREPGNLEIRFTICSLLYETGQYQESLLCFQDYLNINPGHIQALEYLLVLHGRLNNLEDAKRVKEQLERPRTDHGSNEFDHETPL